MKAENHDRRRSVIYIGGYVDEAIMNERGLRSHNAAGSNRMMRIARAIRTTGYQPVLLSPGISLRARSSFAYPARVHRAGPGVAAVFAPAMGLPGLNVLTSPLFQFLTLRAILRRRPIGGVIIYNFNPSLVLLATYLKYVRRLRIVHNIEDVSVPKLQDWLPGSGASALQQLVFWGCMHLIARMSDAYVVPTRRFLDHLPAKPAAVVTGCIGITDETTATSAPPLRVLYAGKIEREHGIREFVMALHTLDALAVSPPITVDISGAGDMADWVERELRKLRHISACFHGFVSASAYRTLLDTAQVCVALQDPIGRYATLKTPSKVYEFLGNGKAVIATDIGDIGAMPEGILLMLPALTSDAIAERLAMLATDPALTATLRSAAHAHAEQNFSYEAVSTVLRSLITGGERSAE